MKKIDLHIHTISTDSDRPFDFKMDRLKEYVCDRALDCIAITNHNVFDLDQFQQIQDALAITVLPGIEIDLEGGQLLLIGDTSRSKDFDSKCLEVTSRAPSRKKPLSVSELREIFGDLLQYLLIPHYEKKPAIKEATLSALGASVTAGEVASPKKFMYCIRNDEALVPVYFSDARMEETKAKHPIRQTYIDCEEVSLSAIRSCLRDKNKVALSANDGNRVFQVFDNGQHLSTGLNVILGGRSTGKSHTLQRIRDAMPKAKYIPQFSLVSSNEKDDEKKFNKFLSNRHSLFSRDHLRELQTVVSEVIDIDLEYDSLQIDTYLKSLLKNAHETEKHDAFSRAKLFNEEMFSLTTQEGLEDLIDSTQNLIENIEYKSMIEKYVPINSLKSLIVELMRLYASKDLEQRKRSWVNDLVRDIKDQLKVRTAATAISDLDLYSIAMHKVSVGKFEHIVRTARTPRELMRKPLQGFELVATVGEFEGALELKELSKLKATFRDAFGNYSNPYTFLQDLKKIDGLEEADLYKFFVKIEFKILNDDGYEASGGERSEFNLLQEIQDAQKSDILLIDEPESSFDNMFLKDSVNAIIRDISRTMPVVLVTHNNTVGASIKPDYILYTGKDVTADGVEYKVYSGYPTNNQLVTTDGESVRTYEVTLDYLEAGVAAYNDRRNAYEDIRD